MGPSSRNLQQDVTYWPLKGTRNDYNRLDFDNAVLIKGRWVIKEQQITNKEGDLVVSTAEIALASSIDVEGYLALGNHVGSPDPRVVPNALRIQAYHEIPDLRLIETRYLAFL